MSGGCPTLPTNPCPNKTPNLGTRLWGSQGLGPIDGGRPASCPTLTVHNHHDLVPTDCRPAFFFLASVKLKSLHILACHSGTLRPRHACHNTALRLIDTLPLTLTQIFESAGPTAFSTKTRTRSVSLQPPTSPPVWSLHRAIHPFIPQHSKSVPLALPPLPQLSESQKSFVPRPSAEGFEGVI